MWENEREGVGGKEEMEREDRNRNEGRERRGISIKTTYFTRAKLLTSSIIKLQK